MVKLEELMIELQNENLDLNQQLIVKDKNSYNSINILEEDYKEKI